MAEVKTKNGTKLQLMNIKGKQYLPVAQRLMWFREEHPDWCIETEVRVENESCLGKATIRGNDRETLSMGHKFETKKSFPDYIEKSETGAIGRALAALGYGTQYAIELDEQHRIVDSPVAPPPDINPDEPISFKGEVSPKQVMQDIKQHLKLLVDDAKQEGWEKEDLAKLRTNKFGTKETKDLNITEITLLRNFVKTNPPTMVEG